MRLGRELKVGVVQQRLHRLLVGEVGGAPAAAPAACRRGIDELVRARPADGVEVMRGQRLPDHPVCLAVEVGVVDVLEVVDRARPLGGRGHERPGQR